MEANTALATQHPPSFPMLSATLEEPDGLRVLAFANQGRNHFDTREAAEAHIAATMNPATNCADTLRSVFGDVTKARVDSVECYDHGDAVGSVLGMEGAK